MVKKLTLLLLIVSTQIYAKETYNFTLAVLWRQDTFKLADGSSFNTFTLNDGYFYDDRGNSGDTSCRGVRETGPNGNLVNLNVICQITSLSGDQFWARYLRKNTDLDGGAGKIKIISATGSFVFLKDATCTYAISFTKKSGMQKAKCELIE
tara:strand:- start:78 stop:530 length:453 start_codon:yes stop_codon:yes gene_type:complete